VELFGQFLFWIGSRADPVFQSDSCRGSPNPLPSGGAIDFEFALIFPKQHPDKLVLPSLVVPGLLLRYTSNSDDHQWPKEVLSLGRCEHQILEQHFPSIPHSGWRSIVVNKATYKEPGFTIFQKKGCKVSRSLITRMFQDC